MNRYLKLKRDQEKRYDEYVKGRLFYAYTDEQFDEGMKSIGLDPDDTDKIYRLTGGAFCRREYSQGLADLLNAFDDERKEAMESDKTGEGYIYDMFRYELGNHEYIVTYDYDEALEACGLTMERVKSDPILKRALSKATKDYMAEMEDYGY